MLEASLAWLDVDADPSWLTLATEIVELALERWIDPPVCGLWRDRLNVEDTFVEQPAPASSFYHIVGAALALDRLARVTTSSSSSHCGLRG